MDSPPRSPLDFLRYSGRLLGRGFLVLWRTLKLGDVHIGVLGIVFVVCGIGAGIGTAISSFFEGLPWEISAAIFLALLFYGVCVASFEEVQRVIGERKEAEKERDILEVSLRESEQELEALRTENEELIEEVATLTKELASRPAAPKTFSPLGAYPFLQADEFDDPSFERKTIYIADLAREIGDLKWTNAVIKNRTFKDCRIYGPAVLVAMNTGSNSGPTFDDCRWAEGTDAFWAAPTKKFVGVIGLEDCLFRDCRIENVTVLLSPAEYEQMMGPPTNQE